MSSLKKIAVICGGYSSESVISLRSADFVMNNINKDKYHPFKVIIEPKRWYCLQDGFEYEVNRADFSITIDSKKVVFDGVYNIIHGTPGEDGKLQAYFEMLNIPVSSSSSIVSGLTFNKAFCNYAVKALGVNVNPSLHLFKRQPIDVEAIVKHVGFPCFVKPNAGGSSIGMSKVKQKEDLVGAIERAYQEDDEVLVEAFFEGREVTCGLIISNGVTTVFPLCEIVSKKEFFDYEAKYTESLVSEIIPAPIDEEVAHVIKATAVYVYKKLNMKGVVRMDFLFNDKTYVFLEANTIPGMSAQSIVPQMARSFGWTNMQLLDTILNPLFA